MAAPSSEEFSLHTEAAGTAPPDAFGPFRVLHQIGAGTLGPVFRAYDPRRERLVAVKLFKIDLPPERAHQLVASFERLVDANLTHPALVAPIFAGISDVSAFLVTDHVAADSLDQTLRRRSQSDVAVKVDFDLADIGRLADALDHGAAIDVTHGTLHPRDVLVDGDEVRLTGIGIAQALERIGVPPPIRRPYTAPERIAQSGWNRRADVFSLAAIAYEALWGRRLSGVGSKAVETATALEGADLATLKGVFGRALAEDPAHRHGTCREFADELSSAFGQIPVSTSAPVAEPVVAVREEAVRLPLEEPQPARTISIDLPPQLKAFPPESPPELVAFGARELDVGSIGAGADPRVRPADSDAGVGANPRVRPADSDADSFWGARRELLGTEIQSEDDTRSPSPSTVPEREPLTVLEQSRSALWPLGLALLVGLALGFASGYGVGIRERAVRAPTTATAAVAPASTREFTEGTVGPENRSPEGSRYNPAPPKPDEVRAASARRVEPTPKRPEPAVVGRGRGAKDARARPSAAAATTPGTTGRGIGSVRVESRPAGAKVFLDGKLIGATPLTASAVSAGDHTVQIELDGYRKWSSSVRVLPNERNRVTASLER